MTHDGAASPAPDHTRRGGSGPKGPADPTEEYAEVIHALMSDGAESPRCGQASYGAPVARYAIEVTCPACRRLLDIERKIDD